MKKKAEVYSGKKSLYLTDDEINAVEYSLRYTEKGISKTYSEQNIDFNDMNLSTNIKNVLEYIENEK